MPFITSAAGSMADKNNYWDDIVYKQTKDSKPFDEKFIDGLKYVLSQIRKYFSSKEEDSLLVIVYDKENIIGTLSTTWEYNSDKVPEKFPKTGWLAVKKEYRNKNIAFNMYKLVIDYYGGVLSDDTMTEASMGVWKNKLLPNYYCYLCVSDFHKNLKITKRLEKSDFDDPKNRKLNNIFVCSKKKIDY